MKGKVNLAVWLTSAYAARVCPQETRTPGPDKRLGDGEFQYGSHNTVLWTKVIVPLLGGPVFFWHPLPTSPHALCLCSSLTLIMVSYQGDPGWGRGQLCHLGSAGQFSISLIRGHQVTEARPITEPLWDVLY